MLFNILSHTTDLLQINLIIFKMLLQVFFFYSTTFIIAPVPTFFEVVFAMKIKMTLIV